METEDAAGLLADEAAEEPTAEEPPCSSGSILWRRGVVVAAVVFVLAAGSACVLTAQGGVQDHTPVDGSTRTGSGLVETWNYRDAASAASSVGELCKQAMGLVGAVKSGEGAWHAGLDLAKAAGSTCVDMTLLMEEIVPHVLVACGAISVGADLLSASDASHLENIVNDRYNHFRAAVDNATVDMKQNLTNEFQKLLHGIEEVEKELACNKIEDVGTMMREVSNDYKDIVLCGHTKGGDSADFLAQMNDKIAHFDPIALGQFVDDLQGCGKSPLRHVPAFLATRSQLFAIRELVARKDGDKEMLQSISKDLHDHMNGFAKVQEDKKLYGAHSTRASKNPWDSEHTTSKRSWQSKHTTLKRPWKSDHTTSKMPSNPEKAPCNDFASLPRDLQIFDIAVIGCECSETGGYLKDLPGGLVFVNLVYCENVEGDLKDLPRGLTNAAFGGSKGITGKLKDLPRALTWASFGHSEKVTGDLLDLPRSLTMAFFAHAKKLKGDVKDLPQSLKSAIFHDSVHITGELKDLPRSIRVVDLHSAGDITGDFGDLPDRICEADFHAANNVGGISGNPPNFENCGYS